MRAELRALREAGARPAISPLASLATDEAAAFVGFKSRDAFYRWARRWAVRPSEHNRWPTHRLNAGLERERMQGGKRRRAKARAAAAGPREGEPGGGASALPAAPAAEREELSA